MNKRKVVVFAPDCTDARIIKRIRAFKDNEFEVIGVSFRRLRYNRGYVPEWDNIELDVIRDRHYIRRIFSIFRSLLVLLKSIDRLVGAKFYYTINLDLVLLAFFTRFISRESTKIVYEVADIQPPFMRKDIFGTVLRFFERSILRRIFLLVVTSPGFIRNYFTPVQRFHGKWYLLENKLYPTVPALKTKSISYKLAGKPGNTERKWVVGYFGAIKCKRSWQIIKFVARKLPLRVIFYLKGYPTRLERDEFFQTVNELPNVIYGGEYRHPDDLAKMHDEIDFVWNFELVNEEHNSKWLLPNRLYEGGYYSVPMLAANGFEVGNYIDRLEIGWTFSEPYDRNLVDFFESLTIEEYELIKKNYLNIPKQQFADDEQFAKMCDIILRE